ncbi:hypothetical protein [Clostridium saccharobutylicum]|uniref:Uncharacterized protein n=1 Tax=Clostridium saccharobutylicum DSM 13864 TaxID=1345695 RepID=U5MUH2_CLOSA|nr:hypothetical protein [Clostridium saccharobutylicum]AGX44183.1 hypothetical protein CLSA_c32170 [Clostridium saccharobutylicum DSM 13864]AQR91470.1 hypothetical protein CLOSC_31950 [Clostridium saccharobutylicum]AQS01374.1 hypothetical protein CSACC_32020 [Clostridium saccharobutylicum]AQS10982.1 hypothetical protein CLOBY_31310 [Clostridium saccharobutylicum]AQS15357.1 hypothetical protein CLOSACC_32020 [Clostridium saccharobutylicum]
MNKDLMDFWRRWVDGEEEINITIDGAILKYSMINKKSNDGVRDWVCFTSKDKLYSFIKYILLPSIQITTNIGIKDSMVYFDVCEYDQTIKLLETFKINTYKEDIEEYKSWLKELEILENNDYNFKNIIDFINNISAKVNKNENLELELKIFENIKSVGNYITNEYEKDNNIGELESKFELNKNEIKDLFDNIDSNKFMQKKILTLLNEKSI